MKFQILALFLCLALLLTGCSVNIIHDDPVQAPEDKPGQEGSPDEPWKPEEEDASKEPGTPGNPAAGEDEPQGEVADLGDDDKTFGEDLADTGAYDGYFEGESQSMVVECVSGTKSAYKMEGTTLTFTAIREKSVYAISGTFRGNIVIDVGEGYKFELELHGLSLVSDATNPITIRSGDEVILKAKKDTKNYIYDTRAAVDAADETVFSGAIHAEVDLEISGKGELTVISEKNSGIHSKDDLQIKNLTLYVACVDNALKGNDGVEIEDANTTLIASGGDCIKTSKSDVSSKGNQRGSIIITGGTHTLYAACDGIDAAYDVYIDGETTALRVADESLRNA